MAVIEIEVSQFFMISQDDTTVNPFAVYVNQTFVMAESVKNYRQWYSAANFFNVGHIVAVRKSINHISVGDYLELHHGGHKVAGDGHYTIEQWISFGSLVELVEYEIVTQTLSITETVYVEVAKAATNTLTITQTVSYTSIRTRELTQTLVVYSGGVGIIEDDDRYSITLPTLTGPNAPECTS